MDIRFKVPKAGSISSGWKNITTFIYLIICMFDFLIMPLYIASDKPKFKDLVAMENEQRTAMMIVMDRYSAWEPLTLNGGGIFHISFGAILAGATVMGKGPKDKEGFHIIMEAESVKSYVRLVTETQLDKKDMHLYYNVVDNYAIINPIKAYDEYGDPACTPSITVTRKQTLFIYEIPIKINITTADARKISEEYYSLTKHTFEIAASYSAV